jgi:hypothetical protein
LLPKSSDPKSNDTCKCPVGHPGHFLVTSESPRFTPYVKSLIALAISTIRTSSLDVRSQVLYPAELRAQPCEVYRVDVDAARIVTSVVRTELPCES